MWNIVFQVSRSSLCEKRPPSELPVPKRLCSMTPTVKKTSSSGNERASGTLSEKRSQATTRATCFPFPSSQSSTIASFRNFCRRRIRSASSAVSASSVSPSAKGRQRRTTLSRVSQWKWLPSLRIALSGAALYSVSSKASRETTAMESTRQRVPAGSRARRQPAGASGQGTRHRSGWVWQSGNFSCARSSVSSSGEGCAYSPGPAASCAAASPVPRNRSSAARNVFGLFVRTGHPGQKGSEQENGRP